MTLFPTTEAATPIGLGTAMVGAKGKLAKGQRRKDDYYPTPAEATHALLLAEGAAIRAALARHGATRAWEPCGRGGAIARVAAEHGIAMVATDLVPDPANHVAQLDALLARRALSPVVVTNPPYGNFPLAFIQHMLFALDVDCMALLLKGNWWHQGAAIPLWNRRRPAREHKLTWRLDFEDAGNPVMTFSWFVWDRAAETGQCITNLLNRDGPVDGRLALLGEEA